MLKMKMKSMLAAVVLILSCGLAVTINEISSLRTRILQQESESCFWILRTRYYLREANVSDQDKGSLSVVLVSCLSHLNTLCRESEPMMRDALKSDWNREIVSYALETVGTNVTLSTVAPETKERVKNVSLDFSALAALLSRVKKEE